MAWKWNDFIRSLKPKPKMDPKSFLSFLEEINPKWTSKSRIFGQAVELWVQENISCECSGKFVLERANKKSYDARCNLCGKKIQIKAQKSSFRPNKKNILSILGSEYKTTLKSIDKQKEKLRIEYA